MVYVGEFTFGMFSALKFAGHWLFRGPWSNDITDHIIDDQVIWGPGEFGGWII